jgi:hypothetical protein
MLPLNLYARVRVFVHVAHETAGAARTRSSLRPLFFKGANEDANLGRIAPRDRDRIFNRHCERSEAIHRAAQEEWIASSQELLAMTRSGPGVLNPSIEPGDDSRWAV